MPSPVGGIGKAGPVVEFKGCSIGGMLLAVLFLGSEAVTGLAENESDGS